MKGTGWCIVALLFAMSANAFAQAYPVRPIRLVIPFAPGGGTDILARVIGPPVSASIGQPVIADNRPGAGGAIGAEITARAEPDGYTFVLVSSSYTATAAFHKLPYHPVNDITPVALLGTTGLVMSVHPSVPVKSVKELIAHARANPKKLNYATVGVGSVTHLAHELFNLEAGITSVHIPFKGGGPALLGTIGGEAHFTMISIVPTLPHAKSGKLRVIGITTLKRSELLPDVPSISEAVPGYEVVHWYGIWGPKGLPKGIVSLWNREVARVLLTDEMKKQLRAEGLEPGGGPPEDLMTYLRPAYERWRRVVREAKLAGTG